MTVRKAPATEGEEGLLQVVDRTLGTKSFRTIILLLILSMHPVGRQILGTVGFEFPDQKKLTVAADEALKLQNNLVTIAETVKDLKSDMATVKANNAIINAKVDRLEQTFTGFQIDFNKYRKPESDK